MDAHTDSNKEFEAELEKRLAEMRRGRIEQFDPRSLAWLALAPAWTERLAVDCRFPPGRQTLADFLKQATDAGLCAQSLPEASSGFESWHRARAIAEIGSRLSMSRLPAVVESLLRIDDARIRVEALTLLLSRLPEEASREIADLALSHAQSIPDESARLEAVLRMARHLPDPVKDVAIEQSFKQARELESTTDRARALAELAPYLPEDRVAEALDITTAISSVKDRASALLSFAPYLSQARGRSAVREAFDIKREAVPRRADRDTTIEDDAILSISQVRSLELIKPLLDEIGNARVARSLVGRLSDAKGEMRRSAIETLALIGEEAIGPLSWALAESDIEMRALAAQALGMIGKSEVAPQLVQAASDEDEKVRRRAIEALGKVKAESALDALVSALSDKAAGVRRAAAEAIGKIGGERAIKPLVERLDDEDSSVRKAAIQSLVAAGEMALSFVSPGRLFEVAGSLRDERNRASTLVSIAPFLGVELRGEALKSAQAIGLEQVRAEALVGLAPHLPPHLLEEALTMALTISDTEDRAEAMIGLAKYLPEELLERSFDAAERIGGDLSFWMPDTARQDAMPELRRRLGASRLPSLCEEIARAILDAQRNGTPVPPLTAQWAELASRASRSTTEAARWLSDQIRDLIKKGDTGQATTWVKAAETLAQPIREMESAVLLGNHQIEIEYRRAQDERQRKHFLERKEQIEEFRRLMESSDTDSAWALHYLGMGGVGKTMLLRHGVARFAPEYGAVTSRIDFDHMSPDFPVRKPGQLLIELAEELRLHNPEVEEFFETLHQRIISFHESLSDLPAPAHPLDYILDPRYDFDSVVATFADFLWKLSRRVVLVLDTAEELAKAPPVQSILPSVAATFEILQKVHEKIPTMRVVFAGRRPLALAGSGWEIDKERLADSDAPGDYAYLPNRKDYLRLHVIRGFTRGEAAEFFTQKRKLEPAPELLEVILNNSPDAGSPAHIVWTTSRTSDAGEERYNPFDLSLYANWVAEDPGLSAARIASGETDPYVELRIINRLNDQDVEAILPAVVLLRRFNKDMLRPACKSSHVDFDEVYRVLGAQEWTDYQRDESLKTTFLEVDRNLHPRLLRYFEQESRKGLLENARSLLAPGLEALIRKRDLSSLGVDHIDAALRLLDEGEATRLWHEASLRIPYEVDSNWLQNVLRSLLGAEGAAHKQGSPLRAAVRAEQTAALTRDQPDMNLADAWKEVEQAAPATPDPEIGRWLSQRAIAGQIAASRVAEDAPSSELMSAFVSLIEEFCKQPSKTDDEMADKRRAQMAASICAGVEALVERAEAGGEDVLLDPALILRWAKSVEQMPINRELPAFAHMLAVRTTRMHDDKYGEYFRMPVEGDALGLLDEKKDGHPPQKWLDWRAPDSVRDRVRLEVLRSTVTPEFYDSRLDDWMREALGSIGAIDSERLVSLIIKRQLEKAPLPALELEPIEKEDTYAVKRARCEAHRKVQPLFASIADGWLALGKAERALEVVDKRRNEATQASSDRLTQRAAIVAKLRIIRRMRLHGRGQRQIASLAASEDMADSAIAWQLRAVNEMHRDSLMEQALINSEKASRLLLLARDRRTIGVRPRAVAEALLEEGELLALRRTGEADSNLNQAYNLFTQANDPAGAAIAAITNAIAAIHAGDRAAAREYLNMARSPYQILSAREESDGLPAWSELESLKDATDRGSFKILDHPSWHGWLRRLARCLIWAADPGGTTTATRLIEDRLKEVYGSLLPVELDLSTSGRDERIAALNKSQRRMDITLGVLILALSFLILAGIGYSVVTQPLTGNRVLLYLAVIFGAAVPVSSFDDLRKWARSFLMRRYALAAAGEDDKSLQMPEPPGWVKKGGDAVISVIGLAFLAAILVGGYLLIGWILQKATGAEPGKGEQAGVYIGLLVFIWSIPWLVKKAKESLPRLRKFDAELTAEVDTFFTEKLFGPPPSPDNRPPNTILLFKLMGFLAAFAVSSGILAAVISKEGSFGPVSIIALNVWAGFTALLVRQFYVAMRDEARSIIALRDRVRLRIQTAGEEATRVVTSGSRVPVSILLWQRQFMLEMHSGLMKPLFKLVPEESSEEVSAVFASAARPYINLAAEMPQPVIEPLAGLQKRLLRRSAPVELAIEPRLAHFPWEAALALALQSPGEGVAGEKLRFWRQGDATTGSTSAQSMSGTPKVNVICSETWASMAEKGWEALQSEVTVINDLSGLRESARAGVLHLIGFPVRTTGGFFLQIGRTRSRDIYQSAEQTGRRSQRSEVLLSADNLPLGGASLLVVQCDPADIQARVDTEREQAGYLRAFASEVFASGAQSVIVLPPLPSPLAQAALGEIALALREPSALQQGPLLDTVSKVRRLITAQPLPDSGDGAFDRQAVLLELAFDICVFARWRLDNSDR
jgi:HEAT repeat protein